MTAPQPTHDQAHEANIQERERGREVLIAGLRESNRALTAEVLKLREDIASNETLRLVNSANEELSKYISELEGKLATLSSARSKCIRHSAVDCVPCKYAAERVLCEWNYGEAFGERIGLCAVFEMADEYKTQRIGIVLRSVANQLRQAIGLSSAPQPDRELIAMKERAEGAERELAGLMRDFQIEGDESVRDIVERTIGSHVADQKRLMEKLASTESAYEMLAQDFAGAKADREAMGVALAAAEAERDSWKERHDAVLEAYSKNRPTTPAEQPGRAGDGMTDPQTIVCGGPERCRKPLSHEGMCAVTDSKEPTP